MDISTYQVSNVLRVYGNQLRNGRISSQSHSGRHTPRDMVTISSGTKRDAVIEKVSSEMLEEIVKNGPQNPDEKEAFKKIQDEHGHPLILSKNNKNKFEFKAIDETGSKTIDIPADMSDDLLEKLKEQIRTTVSKNMI